MLSRVAKLLMTSTAIAPVGFIYAWLAYLNESYTITFVLSIICLILVILCQIILNVAQTHLERHDFTPTTIEASDRENTAFILLYLLPLFTAQFDTLNWAVWLPALVVFVIVVGTGYGYHFNPLLGLLGWHFYKVNTAEGVVYVLITKRELRSAFKCMKTVQLTEYIVLEVEER